MPLKITIGRKVNSQMSLEITPGQKVNSKKMLPEITAGRKVNGSMSLKITDLCLNCENNLMKCREFVVIITKIISRFLT